MYEQGKKSFQTNTGFRLLSLHSLLFPAFIAKVRLPKFATDIIVSISGPISRTLDLKGSAESPGIWL